MKKKLFGTICLVAVLLSAGAIYATVRKNSAEAIQQGIADKIIRFHVIANSDSEEDQRVKLKVKEAVVTEMEPMLKDADSVDEARKIMQLHMEEIEATARETLFAEGRTDDVQAQLTHCYFPVKTYGEYTFPDGDYEALRITIGEGNGKNWWCVMYPRLCFVDSLYSVVPETSRKELKKQLTDEEYASIIKGEKKVKIKWKCLEWFDIF